MSNLKLQRKAKLLEMLEESPNDDFLNFAIAMEELAEENLQLATLYFQKCIEINEAHIPARYQLAKIANQNGNSDTAIQLLNEGIMLLKTKKDLKTLNEFRALLDEIELN